MKKVLTAAVAMGLMASVSLADVTLSYSPDVVNEGETTDIAVSLTSNPGLSTAVGGIGFDYDPASEAYDALNPTGFSWTPAIMGDPNQWFVTSNLPNPQAVAFFEGAAVPLPDGVSVQFATLTVSPAIGTAQPNDPYSLAANLTVADATVHPLTVKGGDPADITIVPEPASLCLLAIGALAVVRRTRR